MSLDRRTRGRRWVLLSSGVGLEIDFRPEGSLRTDGVVDSGRILSLKWKKLGFGQ